MSASRRILFAIIATLLAMTGWAAPGLAGSSQAAAVGSLYLKDVQLKPVIPPTVEQTGAPTGCARGWPEVCGGYSVSATIGGFSQVPPPSDPNYPYGTFGGSVQYDVSAKCVATGAVTHRSGTLSFPISHGQAPAYYFGVQGDTADISGAGVFQWDGFPGCRKPTGGGWPDTIGPLELSGRFSTLKIQVHWGSTDAQWTVAGQWPFGSTGAPSVPTQVTAAPGNTTVTVSWKPPAATGSGPITGYRLSRVTGDPVISQPWSAVVGADRRSWVFNLLQNGRPYTFWVAAINASGESSPMAVTATPTAEEPGAVTAFGLTPGDTVVTMSWRPPANDGGSPITGYRVSRLTGDPVIPTQWSTVVGADQRSWVFNLLQNGRPYLFSVAAINAVGEGAATQGWVTPVPPAVSPPQAPTGLTLSPGNGVARVGWSPPAWDGGAPITGYRVFTSGRSVTTSGTARGATLTGLVNGTSYSVSVVAINRAGEGEAVTGQVTPQAPSTRPGPPTGLVLLPGNATVTVRWAPPASDGGSPVSGYRVTRLTPDPVTVETGPTTRAYTVTGLTNGTAYAFAVTAVNAQGEGPAATGVATPGDFTPPRVALTSPSQPWTLARRVGASWTASDVGFGVAVYEVRLRVAPPNRAFGPWAQPRAWQFITTRAVSTLAVPGTSYCFSVRARDKAGNVGAWSAARCTSVPLDDRGLVASRGWARQVVPGAFLDTMTATSKSRVTLTSSTVVARRLVLFASTGPRHGRVAVYWNGSLLRVVDLAQASAVRRTFTIATFTGVRTGTLTLRTLDADLVRVDAVGLSKT